MDAVSIFLFWSLSSYKSSFLELKLKCQLDRTRAADLIKRIEAVTTAATQVADQLK
jgi:hypothetical protein